MITRRRRQCFFSLGIFLLLLHLFTKNDGFIISCVVSAAASSSEGKENQKVCNEHESPSSTAENDDDLADKPHIDIKRDLADPENAMDGKREGVENGDDDDDSIPVCGCDIPRSTSSSSPFSSVSSVKKKKQQQEEEIEKDENDAEISEVHQQHPPGNKETEGKSSTETNDADNDKSTTTEPLVIHFGQGKNHPSLPKLILIPTSTANTQDEPIIIGSIEPPHSTYESHRTHRHDMEGALYSIEELPSYYMDETEVTNAAFGAFVNSTGYVTDAEQYGWSYVFAPEILDRELADSIEEGVSGASWWVPVPNATWRHPRGPPPAPPSTDSDYYDDNDDIWHKLPARHISWNDASTYCAWAGRRLPHEAEWEHAARGGRVGRHFPWGNREDDLHKRANTFEGTFPSRPMDPPPDGYEFVAPIRSYPPNKYGLYDMSGNVWEWTSTRFESRYYDLEEERGKKRVEGMVLREEDENVRYAQKGGSYMCHLSYCFRYRNSSRTSNTADSTASHTGFRCVADI